MKDNLVYRESLWWGRRTFELLDDRVVLRIRSSGQTSDFTFLLSSLRPDPNVHHIRPKPFVIGFLLVIIPLVLHGYSLGEYGHLFPGVIGGVVGFFGFVGLVVCAYCYRKIEFASFVNSTGIMVFDIGDSGPDRARFQAFVAETIQRIHDSQRPAENPSPTSPDRP
jgi:hypothetical protein